MDPPIELDTQAARLTRLRRNVLTRARIIEHTLGRTRQAWFITLTYRPETEWQPEHIKAFMLHLRRWAKSNGHVLPYVWAAELQKRGAVHYHVVCWLPKSITKATFPKPDQAGWWPHGMSQRVPARNAVGYLAKYVSKGSISTDAKFPKGCRLHGGGGLNIEARASVRWWLLPSWIREAVTPADDVRRAPGGGFVSRATGQWWPSIYQRLTTGAYRFVRRFVWVQQVADKPPALQPRPSTHPSWLLALVGLDGFPHSPADSGPYGVSA